MCSWSWLNVVFLLLLFQLLEVFAQIGTQCFDHKPCPSNQKCTFGYCQCEGGFVKAETYCFKIKSYGEACFINEQCNDIRQECRFPKNNATAKACLCDRYHKWDEEQKVCIHAVTMEALLQQEAMKHETQEVIERNAKYVFEGVVIAGIVAISLGLFFAALCVIYGCCIDRCITPEEYKCPPNCQHQQRKAPGSTDKKGWDHVVATMPLEDADFDF